MDLKDALESGKFTLDQLTAAINNTQVPQMRIAELGIYKESGINTKNADIEYKNGKLNLIPETQRGRDGTPLDDADRKTYNFKSIHLKPTWDIYADEIMDIRAFGSMTELQQLDDVINDKQSEARIAIDLTIEWLRMGGIFGKVIGAKGNVIVDLFQHFGIKESDGVSHVDFNGNRLPAELLNIKRDSERNQGGMKSRRYRGFATADYMDQMLLNNEFYKAFRDQNNGQALRDDMRGGVLWQNTFWEEYDLTIGEGKEQKRFLGDKGYDAVVFPEDRPDLFLTRFAPADYNETIGSRGLPYYSKSKVKDYDRGVEGEAQSNPINVCTQPLAVRRIKMTKAAQAGS